MAAGEGFEPPQTESESGVLPLHKPAVLAASSVYYYTHGQEKVKQKFPAMGDFFGKAGGKVLDRTVYICIFLPYLL